METVTYDKEIAASRDCAAEALPDGWKEYFQHRLEKLTFTRSSQS